MAEMTIFKHFGYAPFVVIVLINVHVAFMLFVQSAIAK